MPTSPPGQNSAAPEIRLGRITGDRQRREKHGKYCRPRHFWTVVVIVFIFLRRLANIIRYFPQLMPDALEKLKDEAPRPAQTKQGNGPS